MFFLKDILIKSVKALGEDETKMVDLEFIKSQLL